MSDIKKITEEEIAKSNPTKQIPRAKIPTDASPERKKKGKIQWKKLPMDVVGKSTHNGKTSQPKKGYHNASMWNGSGKGQNGNKSNSKGDKGNGATKPWSHNSGKSKSQGMVALNVKGNNEKSGRDNQKKSGNTDKGQKNNQGHYQNNNTKQKQKQKQSKPQQSKNKDQSNKDGSKGNGSGRNGGVSAQANPYQPGQNNYGQNFEFQNGFSYQGFEQNGYGYDYNSGYYVPPPPLEETAGYARKQIEYYFTTENLLRDMYLRAQFDEDGYVPIALLANFRAVYNVHQDYESLLTALTFSEILDVNVKYELVRLREGWNHWVVPNPNGGYGQPSYIKAAEAALAEASDSEKMADNEVVEEPHKESEPTENLESSSVGSSDSEGTDVILKKMEELKTETPETPAMAAAH